MLRSSLHVEFIIRLQTEIKLRTWGYNYTNFKQVLYLFIYLFKQCMHWIVSIFNYSIGKYVLSTPIIKFDALYELNNTLASVF